MSFFKMSDQDIEVNIADPGQAKKVQAGDPSKTQLVGEPVTPGDLTKQFIGEEHRHRELQQLQQIDSKELGQRLQRLEADRTGRVNIVFDGDVKGEPTKDSTIVQNYPSRRDLAKISKLRQKYESAQKMAIFKHKLYEF